MLVKIINGLTSHQMNGLGLNIPAITNPNSLKVIAVYPNKNLKDCFLLIPKFLSLVAFLPLSSFAK